MRQITSIIIHCTATRPNWWAEKTSQEKVNEIRRWHVEDRGWSDIGYHYLIDRDGTVIEGRPLSKIGAHAKGHNTGSVGISLFGGHGGNAADDFADNFTEDQDKSLRGLVAKLKDEYPIAKIIGHNEVANKACPTFVVGDWLAGHRDHEPKPLVASQARTSATQSGTVRASAVTVASGAGSAVAAMSSLDSTAQYIVLAFAGLAVLSGIWIMRERLRKWADGHR